MPAPRSSREQRHRSATIRCDAWPGPPRSLRRSQPSKSASALYPRPRYRAFSAVSGTGGTENGPSLIPLSCVQAGPACDFVQRRALVNGRQPLQPLSADVGAAVGRKLARDWAATAPGRPPAYGPLLSRVGPSICTSRRQKPRHCGLSSGDPYLAAVHRRYPAHPAPVGLGRTRRMTEPTPEQTQRAKWDCCCSTLKIARNNCGSSNHSSLAGC